MHSDDDWLAQLRQIYETDRALREAEEQSRQDAERVATPKQLLQACKAHEVMRQVQKTLLDGGGKLQFYENVGGYSHAIVLMWTGPISNASEPANIEDVGASIIVGANREGVFVNDRRLAEASPGALKEMLLEVARRFVADRER